MASGKKYILIFLALLCIIVLCVGCLLLYAAFAAFEDAPLRRDFSGFDPKSAQSAFAKIQKAISSPAKVESLVLNQKEVNSLLLFALNSANIAMMPGNENGSAAFFRNPANYNVTFNNGSFLITFSRKLEFDNPFGDYVNARLVVVPEISGEDQNIRVVSSSLGDIPLPVSMVDSRLDGAMEHFKHMRNLEKYSGILKEFKVDKDNNLVIKFDPARVRSFADSYLAEKFPGFQPKHP